LLTFIKSYAKGSILDLGSGTGILAKEAMKYSRDVLAADINQESVSYCKKQGIKAVKSDLFSNIKGKFDLIIFNPPYLPSGRFDKGKDTTGGKKGNEIFAVKSTIPVPLISQVSTLYDACTSIRYVIKFFSSLYPSIVKNYQSFLKAVHRRCKRT